MGLGRGYLVVVEGVAAFVEIVGPSKIKREGFPWVLGCGEDEAAWWLG